MGQLSKNNRTQPPTSKRCLHAFSFQKTINGKKLQAFGSRPLQEKIPTDSTMFWKWQLWGSNPRPCGLAPWASALDHSAKLSWNQKHFMSYQDDCMLSSSDNSDVDQYVTKHTSFKKYAWKRICSSSSCSSFFWMHGYHSRNCGDFFIATRIGHDASCPMLISFW